MNLENVIENEKVEFKKGFPSGERLAREVIAFANTGGGRIIIGYDETTQEVVGVKPDQRTEEKIANIISDYCTPRIYYSLSYETCKYPFRCFD